LTAAEITELINQAFGFMEDKIAVEQVDAALEGIVEKYDSEFYPFDVRQSGGGWQFLTKKEYHKTVAQLNGEKFLKRLSAAALETLAIIAYKQPVTKGEIESIRGVSSDYAVQKLLEKELILISGRNEKLPGHPLIYATSKTFMDYFGINSPEDLPKIREVLADQVVEPTVIHHTDFEQSEVLAVSDIGELIASEDAPEPEGYVNGHAFENEVVSDESVSDEAEPDESISDEFVSDEEDQQLGDAAANENEDQQDDNIDDTAHDDASPGDEEEQEDEERSPQ
jgi:segregation and condensation protein B